MPKKKASTPQEPNTKGFLVRLPEAYRAKLEELRKKADRSFTASVRRGLDHELKINGIDPPPSAT